jgi:hypothetical protein
MAYIGQDPVIGRYIIVDQISGGFNGTASGFTLAAGGQGVIPGLAQNVLLSLGGVIQQPGTDYTVSGSGITFTTPPLSGTTFFATVLGDVQAVGTPSDGTVLPASIATSGTFVFPNITTTGTTLIASGNASTPSLAVIGDTNTGLYSPGADQLAISSNGTGRVFVDSAGKVGIGGASVAGLLQLKYATDVHTSFRNATAGGLSAGTLIESVNDAFNSYNPIYLKGSQFAFGTDAAGSFIERLSITSAGLVGVGTSSPVGKLHVEGGQTYMNRSGAGNQQVLQLNNSDTTAGTQIVKLAFGSSGATKASINAAVYGNDYLAFNTGSDTERMRLTGTGLGVGTSAPGYKFEVDNVGGSTATARLVGNDQANVRLRIQNTGSGGRAYEIVGGLNGANNSHLSVYDATAAATRLTITETGAVGIGTSSPVTGAQLTVAGSGLAVTGQNIAHSANSIRIGEEGSGAAQIRCYGPDASTNGSLTFVMSRSDGLNSKDVVIDSSGRLGIGTSPSELLHVSGGLVRLEDGASGSVIRFYKSSAQTAFISNRSFGFHDGNGLALQTSTADPIRFAINDSEAVRIDSSKRLLVGTSSLSANVRAAFRGNSFGAGVNSTIYMMRDAANPVSGQALGVIDFTDSNEGIGAEIAAVADANWGAGDYPGRLVFFTTADGASSPSERMRINSNGIVVARNSVGDTLNLYNAVSAGTSNAFIYGAHSSASAYTGTTSFVVWTNGNVVNTNGSYTTISDAKLKENIVSAGSQWNDIKAIQIRNWNFKAETGNETHRQIGPIAQEVEAVCPGLVFEIPDRDQDGNETGEVTKGINQSVLYMKAVKALQEAIAKIETLEGMVAVNNITIDEQQHQLSTLAARLTALESA